MSRPRGWFGIVFCVLASVVLVAAGCQSHDIIRPTTPSQVTIEVPRVEVPEGRPIVHRRSQPPMGLTASDGTGLRLASVRSRSVVEGPLAFTELDLAFDNPEARTLEGRFSITLPPQATVSRFAMKIEDDWQEAEVVETKEAREAYEDFLHRKQDPALLEQSAGNEFSARVFPIPANARKEIVLSYVQQVTAGATPVVPLQGLPEIDSVDVAVQQVGAPRPFQAIRREKYKPSGDFGFDPAAVQVSAGVRAGNLVVVPVRLGLDTHPDPIRSAAILVDTSASRALGLDDEIRVLDAAVRKVVADGGPQANVVIACFDQTVDTLYEGAAIAFGETHRARIRARQALGASNLEQALRWTSQHAKPHDIKRVILITDGVATAGEINESKLRQNVKGLAEVGIERLDVVAVGGLRDEVMLRGLVTSGLARDGVVAEADSDAASLERKLTRITHSGIPVQVENAGWSWPSKLDGVQSGDEVVVVAEVPEGQPVRVKVGNEPAEVYQLVGAERALLERTWARSKIDSLLDRERAEGSRENLSKEIVDLSKRYRVLSPYTSMLVLETDDDYARFGLDRRALSDVLVVRDGRVVSISRQRSDSVQSPIRIARNAPPTTPAPSAANAPVIHERTRPPADSETSVAAGGRPGVSSGAGLGLSGMGEGGGGLGEGGIGLGSVGSLGHGSGTVSGSGFGTGHGRLSGSHRAQSPQVRMGATEISGRIPPELVQRVVRQSYGRFRRCYQNGLHNDRNLSGRVVVRFVIDTHGAVSVATDSGSDLRSPTVIECVVQAFYSLQFPQPSGGVVTVVYPIVFSPEGLAGGADPREAPPVADKPAIADPYSGTFKQVMFEIAAGRTTEATDLALSWRTSEPGNVLAYVATGEAAEARGDVVLASRAYGSIIDLYPARADFRRFAAAWIKAQPKRAGEILDRLRKQKGTIENAPSLRFVLNWETDANDVDLHVFDDRGGHAFFGRKNLPSGGELYADVTTGYGPECFAIRTPKAQRAGVYTLQANYYSRGPMGYGMGKLEIIDHDGQGGLTFDERPYVVMVDRGFVDLGTVKK